MATVQLALAPDTVRMDLTAETAARIAADAAEAAARAAADAAIIASGNEPANVGIAPVIATGTVVTKTVRDWTAQLSGVTSVKESTFGAVGDGVADDTAAIEAAIASIDPSAGGRLYFPAGTYRVTNNIRLIDYENIEIFGDGMDRTAIVSDIPNVADGNQGGDPNNMLAGGIVMFAPTVNGGILDNVTVRDLKIQGRDPGQAHNHSLYTNGVNGLVVERVHFDVSQYETLYMVGPDGSGFYRITDCKFTNMLSDECTGTIDTNTRNANDIVITGCHFEEVYFAIAVLGRNVVVSNNTFRKISGKAIAIGESNFDARFSLASCVVDGNVIESLGYPQVGLTGPCVGIDIITRGLLYSDDSEDLGVIVSNNTIVNTLADIRGAKGIRASGGRALIEGNYIAGLTGAIAGTVAIEFDTAVANPKRFYINSNVVERTQSDNWNYGVACCKSEDIRVELSGNHIAGNISALLVNDGTYGAGSDKPEFTFSGDVFQGNFNIGMSPGSEDNSTGALDLVPIFGSTATALFTGNSRWIGAYTNPMFTTGATPNVAGRSLVQLWYGGTENITGFSGGVIGQVITIVSYDTTHTIVDGGTLKLAGNFNAGAGASPSTITLLCMGSDTWIELGRSVN